MVKVVKRDGREEEFVKEKIVVSCFKAGAPIEVAREIADSISSRVKEGTTTEEIAKMVLEELERRNPEWSANYELYDLLVKGRVTYERGRYFIVPKGHPLYLGTQVRDIGERGLSSPEEVAGILEQLREDLEHGISRATIHRRTYILFLAVLRTSKMSKEDKLKSIEMINKFREEMGWRPFKLKRSLR